MSANVTLRDTTRRDPPTPRSTIARPKDFLNDETTIR